MNILLMRESKQLKIKKMKKTFIFLSLITMSLCTLAQTSFVRTSLYEGFTGENCGPCLGADTILNAVLLSNPALVIPIKWEVPVISAPTNTWSMYQTNKAEINWRFRSSTGSTLAAGPSTLAYGYPSQNTPTNVATNGINMAPTGRFDGQHQWVFGATSDDPSSVSNSVIANAQAQATNFSINMTPNWSPTYTNCIVNVTVTSLTSFTALGAFMFRLCLVERVINFSIPAMPGINGERKFNDVVRKSYPTTIVGASITAMGTPLNNIWTPGQTQIFTVNCNIPPYIRDLSQMAFVGFVQDDGDRKVYQASRTPQPAIPNDIKVVSVNVPLSCTGTYSPSFVAQNLGTVAVTALTVAPYLDGVAQTIFNYTGNIAGGSSVTIALPNYYTAANGSHNFSLTVTGVSGGDINTSNNTIEVPFGVSNITTPGVAEPFTTFPPVNWYVLNYYFSPATWGYGSPGGFGTSIGSAKYDFWNDIVLDDVGELHFPALNLTGVANPVISFDVAYAQYDGNQNDKLDLMVSTDCGANWTNAYSKQGAVLATAPSLSTSAFVPSAAQWRTETINLPSLANQPYVIVKFVATSNFGNNLYVDNVNLGQPPPTSIRKIAPGIIECELFPNPTSGLTNLSISLSENETVGITIMNSIGQLVYSSKNNNLYAGINNISLNAENWVSGVYFVNISTPKGLVNTKLNITK
jgi:hypothetical protein